MQRNLTCKIKRSFGTIAGVTSPPRLGAGSTLGSVTQRRIARSFFAWCGLILAGASIMFASSTASFDAFGLGLAAPGAGFVLCLSPTNHAFGACLLLAMASAGLFGIALFLWFATGNLMAAPLVWILSAIGAGVSAQWLSGGSDSTAFWPVGLLAVAAVVGSFGLKIWRPVAEVARSQSTATAGLGARTSPLISDQTDEMQPDDLARLRFLLDRALQPVDQFEGFKRLDPFQSAALRYQLQFSGMALAIAQRHCLPALGSYLTEAQARLVEKTRHHRVWRYWALENLWGRGRLDPNPLVVDNVMFTGFGAMQIALFQAASGDFRFSRDGAFSLHHPDGRRFKADFRTMVGNIVAQHRRSAFGLIACEPNWLFPLCNSIGYVAIAAHDAQFGSADWTAIGMRQEAMLNQEFRNAKGRFVTCRSSLTGFSMPSIGGALTELMPSLFLNATMPDLAHDNWHLIRDELIRTVGSKAEANLKAFWPIDVGNYRFTRIAGLSGAAATAVEMGDGEGADALLDALDRLYPLIVRDDIGHRNHGSIWAHAFELIARSSRTDGLRDLVRQPRRHDGAALQPYIAHCPYPDALVAKACFLAGALTIVLRPGASNTAVDLKLAGLKPSTRYRRIETGEIFASDQAGSATISIALAGRTPVTVQREGTV